MIRKSVAVRFLEKVDKSDAEGCWLWTGSRTEDGYGVMMIDGRKEIASRVAYRIQRGAIPEGLNVLHSCDNPPCVRGSHLFTGTQVDNAVDMLSKGRGNKASGEVHAAAKLTAEDVRTIRASHVHGRRGSLANLARRFGVSTPTIYGIVTRRKWKGV